MFSDFEVSMDVKARDIVHSSAQRAYPGECCGFLWGNNGMITVAAEVDNVSTFDKLQHFEINARTFMAAEKFADTNGLTLMGVFHSHPDSVAEPSDMDQKSALPNFLYIIVAVRNHVVIEERLWVLDDCGYFKERCMQGTTIESSNR